MNFQDITRIRLANQHIPTASFERPEEVVLWFGSMQAQDYSAAKWAVALRSTSLTDKSLDEAFADGKILRTHVLRPTWQFVTPADIYWMLQLSAQRIHQQMAHWYRASGLDTVLLKKTDAIIAKILQGNKQLTRPEIASVLKQSNIGVELNNLRLTFIMLHAEVEGVICSGALTGKQHTYALLDERAPQTKKLTHDEALAELTKRYFLSHGPATIKDYSWWSGLSTARAKDSVEMLEPKLDRAVIDEKEYFFIASENNKSSSNAGVYLLPNFDEYIIGYAERSDIFDSSLAAGLDARHNPLFQNTILIDGQIIGTWKHTFQKSKVTVTAKPFIKLQKSDQELLKEAMVRYSEFMNLQMELVITSTGFT